MEGSRATLDSFVKINEENVVSRELDGEAVILDMKGMTYLGLNQVGTRIWALIQEDGSLRKVFAALQNEYEVSPEALEADLLQLIDRLSAQGLISLRPMDEPR